MNSKSQLFRFLDRPLASDNGDKLPPLKDAMLGEFLGTFVMVFFGIGVVHAAVISGAQIGLWQVAAVWAVGVTLGIYTAASLSGAHINPAITAVVAVYDGFPWRRVIPYWTAQVAGAAFAGIVLYLLYANAIVAFELQHDLVRGEPGSQLSAMIYGEYFPNPAVFGTTAEAFEIVDIKVGFAAEAVGTAMLAFIVSVVTHGRNYSRPQSAGAAVAIGVGVAAIISVLAPLSQAGLNPARDFGPRLIAYFAGWDGIAIPGPQGGWFIVYILGPIVGALVGGGIYRFAASRLPREKPQS